MRVCRGKGEGHTDATYSSACSALREADVILLVGARLNWILHFGRPPRFNKNVKFIQIDVCPEELSNNSSGGVLLCGSIKAVIGQVSAEIKGQRSKVCHLLRFGTRSRKCHCQCYHVSIQNLLTLYELRQEYISLMYS